MEKPKIFQKINDQQKAVIIVGLFVLTLLYAIPNDILKKIAHIIAIFITISAIFIALKNKMKFNTSVGIMIIYFLYNIIMLCTGVSSKAFYLVFQQLALIAFSCFILQIKINDELFDKIAKIFSIVYYVILAILCVFIIIGKEQVISNNISITVYKAFFVMSFFPYYLSKRKILFSIISTAMFFIIGERTAAMTLVIIYIFDNLFKVIKNKYIFYSIFWIVIILLFSFIHIYIYLPNTELGAQLNEYSREITHSNFFSGRHHIWNVILESVETNKLFGLSFNNNIELYYDKILSTHNLYLWLILNGGYVLLILFLIYMFSIWVKYFNNLENSKVRIGATYFIGFLVLCNFELLLLNNNFVVSLYMWFVIAISASFGNISENSKIIEIYKILKRKFQEKSEKNDGDY